MERKYSEPLPTSTPRVRNSSIILRQSLSEFSPILPLSLRKTKSMIPMIKDPKLVQHAKQKTSAVVKKFDLHLENPSAQPSTDVGEINTNKTTIAETNTDKQISLRKSNSMKKSVLAKENIERQSMCMKAESAGQVNDFKKPETKSCRSTAVPLMRQSTLPSIPENSPFQDQENLCTVLDEILKCPEISGNGGAWLVSPQRKSNSLKRKSNCNHSVKVNSVALCSGDQNKDESIFNCSGELSPLGVSYQHKKRRTFVIQEKEPTENKNKKSANGLDISLKKKQELINDDKTGESVVEKKSSSSQQNKIVSGKCGLKHITQNDRNNLGNSNGQTNILVPSLTTASTANNKTKIVEKSPIKCLFPNTKETDTKSKRAVGKNKKLEPKSKVCEQHDSTEEVVSSQIESFQNNDKLNKEDKQNGLNHDRGGVHEQPPTSQNKRGRPKKSTVASSYNVLSSDIASSNNTRPKRVRKPVIVENVLNEEEKEVPPLTTRSKVQKKINKTKATTYNKHDEISSLENQERNSNKLIKSQRNSKWTKEAIGTKSNEENVGLARKLKRTSEEDSNVIIPEVKKKLKTRGRKEVIEEKKLDDTEQSQGIQLTGSVKATGTCKSTNSSPSEDQIIKKRTVVKRVFKTQTKSSRLMEREGSISVQSDENASHVKQHETKNTGKKNVPRHLDGLSHKIKDVQPPDVAQSKKSESSDEDRSKEVKSSQECSQNPSDVAQSKKSESSGEDRSKEVKSSQECSQKSSDVQHTFGFKAVKKSTPCGGVLMETYLHKNNHVMSGCYTMEKGSSITQASTSTIYFVTQGSATVRVSNETKTKTPQDSNISFFISKNSDFSIINEKEKPLKMLFTKFKD